MDLRRLFQTPLFQFQSIPGTFIIFRSVLNVALSFKPFDLGPCIFPSNVGFGILDFPWVNDNNIAFTNPHFFMFGAWDPTHSDNSVHTLECYPFRTEQTCDCCQDFISVLAGTSYPGYFRSIS